MKKRHLDRHRSQDEEEIESDLGNQPWTIQQYAEHHRRVWEMHYNDARPSQEEYDAWCRHAAWEVAEEAKQRGDRWRIDVWEMDDNPRGTTHATVCIGLADPSTPWFLIETSFDGYRYIGHSRSISRNGTGSWDGLQVSMVRDGFGKLCEAVDCGFVQNIAGGRNVTQWLRHATVQELARWGRQYFRIRMQHSREVRTGESQGLVGSGRGQRKTEI